MGHCISVFIMNKSELRDRKIDSVINDKELIKDEVVWTELKEGILATTYIPNIKNFGSDKTIAKISTDYFGGPGHQTAKLFVNNELIYEDDSEFKYCEPINGALKLMGVVAKSGMDEFDTIGLGDYRHNSDFLPSKFNKKNS